MKLTEAQKEAVLTTSGPVVVIASAGSGKTSAFTTRIGYMIKEKNISPYNIMAITFTKKASEEMQGRLRSMIRKTESEQVEMGTTHSIFYKLIRTHDGEFAKLKVAPNWWRFSLLNDMCKRKSDRNPNGLGLSDMGIKAGDLSSFISHQKSNMIEYMDDVLIDDRVEYVKHVPRKVLQEAYINYEILKNNSRQIDFDDILLETYKLLKTDQSFVDRLKEQYRYIMIDEFQDTSKIVLEIIKMINKENVFAVGDFRQSVYGFINADVGNILNFDKEFKNAKIIEMKTNFRSTQNIVSMSNDIIKHSEVDEYKNYSPSESVAEVGDPVKLTLYSDESNQVSSIANSILNNNESFGTPLKEMAILVRTNAQTAVVEDTLANLDVPYEVTRSTSFFDRREILDILSYARLALDNKDDESFRRIYNTPNRYLSNAFIHELDSYASDNNIHLYEALRTTPHNKEWKFRNNIEKIQNIVDKLSDNVDKGAGDFIRMVIQNTNYKKYIEETATTPFIMKERIESVDRLSQMANKFPTIKAFLAHILKIKDKQKKSKGKDAVQIVTMHSSKGLEWDDVYVINCNDDVLPHEMSGTGFSGVEEERRLFYVACSRPRKKLYVSWCMYNSDINPIKESRFVRDLIGKENIDSMRKDLFSGSQESTFLYPTALD